MIAIGPMTMPCLAIAPSSRIAIETPEIVTVRFDEIEVVFTRAEYTQIEAAARAAGKSVERWLIDAALVEASRAPSTMADRHGMS